MKIYLGFDDTDTPDSDRGTGKLARWFENEMPDGCRCLGVVRQQLLVDENIPYTSHNSSACVIADVPEPSYSETLVELAARHVEKYFLEGSDPGICAVLEDDPALNALTDYGRDCTCRVMSQKDALQAARSVHLSGHGGTNDGIIGAAAAVGLTAAGWYGRFIEFGRLRKLPDQMTVNQLEALGIQVVSLDRDASIPKPDEVVMTNRWVRPRMLGQKPVLPVASAGKGVWENIGRKRGRKQAASPAHELQELCNSAGSRRL
ncbi:MAG: hypothetical protein PVG35_20365 [Desulfobacterales bacterium]|jgi:hypothetical protein